MWRLRKKQNTSFDIDEIFIDGRNTPGYHRESLEGVLEQTLSGRIFIIMGVFFLAITSFFAIRLLHLQILKGQAFQDRSEHNYLRTVPMLSERGMIYDREGAVLAGNVLQAPQGATTSVAENDLEFLRRYPEQGFLHVLGFLSKAFNPPRGVSGIEASYDERLRGQLGSTIEEVNAAGVILSSGIQVSGVPGASIKTSLLRALQLKLAESIRGTAQEHGFMGGAAVVLAIPSGEVLALVSVPDFDPNILVRGNTKREVSGLLSDPKRPFFNRAISGLYAPGSIIKPAIALAALTEGVIDPHTEIVSTGSLTLPNPYHPDKPSVFLDWKAHGAVDMRKALAVSSDVYFYEIGGGYQGQHGLGVNRIRKYLTLFGFANRTGIDLPAENVGSLPDPSRPLGDGRSWGIGDTYHFAIGQGDLVVTPIEMAVYVASLALRGVVVQPHIATHVLGQNQVVEKAFSHVPQRTIEISKDNFDIAREGMHDAVRYGTAKGLGGYPIEIAAKTGTAEVGKTGRVHSWSIGFFPYEQPKVAFAIIMENGPVQNTIGATYVASQMISWMLGDRTLERLP